MRKSPRYRSEIRERYSNVRCLCASSQTVGVYHGRSLIFLRRDATRRFGPTCYLDLEIDAPKQEPRSFAHSCAQNRKMDGQEGRRSDGQMKYSNLLKSDHLCPLVAIDSCEPISARCEPNRKRESPEMDNVHNSIRMPRNRTAPERERLPLFSGPKKLCG